MARRPNHGYSSLQRHLDSQNHYSTLSTSLLSSESATLTNQLQTFTSALTAFSTTHRAQILTSPLFRAEFTRLCSTLGVDPLGGGKKKSWDKLGLGEWYLALSVQIVDVLLKERERHGGLIRVEIVVKELNKKRGGKEGEVTLGDLEKSIALLGPLECGYRIIDSQSEQGSTTAAGTGVRLIQCHPQALETDTFVVIQSATSNGFITLEQLHDFKRGEWNWERCQRALDKTVEAGMCWIDLDGAGSKSWFVAGLWAF